MFFGNISGSGSSSENVFGPESIYKKTKKMIENRYRTWSSTQLMEHIYTKHVYIFTS